MPVGSPGSVITRGLGSPLLITRGYGTGFSVVVIDEIQAPAQIYGGSKGTKRPTEPTELCYTVKARIITVNDNTIADPVEYIEKNYYVLGDHVNAKLVDIDIKATPDNINVTANLDHVYNVPTTITADIASHEQIGKVVQAKIKTSSKSDVNEIFIAVKKIALKEHDDK